MTMTTRSCRPLRKSRACRGDYEADKTAIALSRRGRRYGNFRIGDDPAGTHDLGLAQLQVIRGSRRKIV